MGNKRREPPPPPLPYQPGTELLAVYKPLMYDILKPVIALRVERDAHFASGFKVLVATTRGEVWLDSWHLVVL